MADLKPVRTSRQGHQALNLKERPDNDTLLKLYALYKQGAEGDVSGPSRVSSISSAPPSTKPGPSSRAPADDAKKKYVDLVKKLAPDPAPSVMARQTRERILDISLDDVQHPGEPNVTTNHIADELEISPGNLYYHFRNKDDIIEQLFARYEERIDRPDRRADGRLPNLEDIWLQLHLVFECIWEFRFLYRDLVDILSRNRKLRMHFARILKRAVDSVTVMRGLVQAGVMRASATRSRRPPPTSS
jgi:AcrR family transcriptional regulator